jgi:hypothetical protein
MDKKDGSNSLFDVTMGSFDGAEICELVRGLARETSAFIEMTVWLL